ncbi:hypothetical protein SAMN05421738_10468 [Algoriella xinjiangensis]|uniref:Tetratricopeptide repeat-containing protein n=1 Tax=Algoriella xinjiangensis TaxID=684065 RepID=A0A1I4UQY1_9FLAO|nr:tetratricopeptide repeat protein [Algoriella xinjiangensis]SFM91394.1 hypothetical protein SAMN05421738_10468 [Algoriella xinjiangensis]VDH18231.1 Uncharacterised protein [Algoriella xinjiangensis]
MTRIEYLVAHPYEVEKSDIPLLKKEVEKYPYFYTLRALLLYGLKKENHPSFEDYLNKTSIHSSNRVDLYHYINSKPLPKEEKIIENVQENSTIKENTIEQETESFNDEKLEEEVLKVEPISLIEEDNIDNDLVDEMIENDTEESELRTDHVVEIISEDELNKVVEESKLAHKTSDQEIENAVLQTSGIEISVEKPQPEEKNTIQETEENNLVEISESVVIIDEMISEEKEVMVQDSAIIEEKLNNNLDKESFSFSDWLKKVPSQSKDQKTIEAEQETAEREIKYKLIDDFLEKNPKIIPMKKTDITPIQVSSNFSHNSEEYSDLMTETLAQIYIEQRKYDKAIKAYKILILKYPEKNSLFANRIKEIENLKNSK